MDQACRDALMKMKFDSKVIALFEEKSIDYETLTLMNKFPETISQVTNNDLKLTLQLRQRLSVLMEAKNQGVDIVSFLDKNVEISSNETVILSSQSGSTSIISSESDTIDSVTISCDENFMDNEIIPPKRIRLHQVEVPAGANVSESHPDVRPCRYVTDLLNESAVGKTVIATYEQLGLDGSTRCRLSELIIAKEYGKDTNTQIVQARFRQLADWIVECFPGESASTYYVASSDRGKGKSATGKLYDCYTNLNKDLRKLKLRQISAGPKGLTERKGETGERALLPACPNTDDINVKRALEYLELHVEPWALIQEYWETSCAARLHMLRGDEGATAFPRTSDYIRKFPALLQIGGLGLIEKDFKVLFPTADVRMTQKWSEFSLKLKHELNRAGVRDTGCDAELLYNIPRLFNVIPVKVPGKKPWRATRGEIQDGFLVHIKVIGDFDKSNEDLENNMRLRGTQLQPYALIVGASLKNISSSYIVIDGKPLLVGSPIRAVDVAFKVYHALYCSYPVQSERVWMLLQKALYGINEDNESSVKSNAEVLRLIDVLKVV